MKYLDSINVLLREVGTRAVSSQDINHPDVVDAKALLQEYKDKVLQRGWWFNRMKSVLLTPDSNKNIAINSNVVRFEITHDYDLRQYPLLAKRKERLLNMQTNSYSFDTPVTLDLFITLDWDDLPPAAQDYITAQAASAFVRIKLEDTARSNMLMNEANTHMAVLHSQELSTEKNNMFDSPAAASMRMRRRPFRKSF